MRRTSMSAAWRVRFYFSSHVKRLELTHCLRDMHISERVPARNRTDAYFSHDTQVLEAFPGKIEYEKMFIGHLDTNTY